MDRRRGYVLVIDNNGDYNPDNCRWATPQEQANNKSNNVVLQIRGKKQIIAQWAKDTEQPATRLYKRKEANWNDYEIIFGKQL